MKERKYSWQPAMRKDWAGSFYFEDSHTLIAPNGDCAGTIAKQGDGQWLWVLNRSAGGDFFYKEGKSPSLEAAKAAIIELIPSLQDAEDKTSGSARPMSEYPDTRFDRYSR